MDVLTITDLTFLVTDDILAPVGGVVAYDTLTKTATFNPDSDLLFDTEYTVTITTGVEDLTGIAMTLDYIWTFTTVSDIENLPPTIISTIPLDKAIDVAIDTDISAQFSEEMDVVIFVTTNMTANLSLVDNNGKEVWSKDSLTLKNGYNYQLITGLGKLNAGVYFLRLSSEIWVDSLKLLKN